MHMGSCSCGAVTFEVTGDLPPPDACHCRQCRKQSGHYFASTDVPRSSLTIHGADAITWFRSSERYAAASAPGVVRHCSGPGPQDRIGIAMGAFDTPTRTRLAIHIFVADKGDYYDICDGLPQNQH